MQVFWQLSFHSSFSQFCLSENVFILFQLFRNIFAYRMIADFSIINLKCYLVSWPYIFLMRIYASFVSLFSYLYVSFFFLAAFKILFYILSFIHLTLMFLGVVYSVFILLGFGWSSWFCVLECFHQIRRVWDHFFSLLLYPWNSIGNTNLVYFTTVVWEISETLSNDFFVSFLHIG